MRQALQAAAIGAALVFLAGCETDQRGEEQALIAQFDMIESRAAFVAAAVGPNWSSDEISVRFREDGSLRGDINGVPVTGQWEWRDGAVCSTFRVSDSGGTGCSKVGSKPGELLVVPFAGEGAPYTYRSV